MNTASILALSAAITCISPALAGAATTDAAILSDPTVSEVVVSGKRVSDSIEAAPSTRAGTTAETIAATVNAVSVEDTLKYLPSLVVRKRHVGDNFAPIATRTSGLGASARSLIFADGALLSALIGNNNGNGSPRWTLVTPEEIERVDVLYGPFSAAYSGNSIGTTVNITTRMPDKLEARATALVNQQDFSLYGTSKSLATHQLSASIGDRIGSLAVLGTVTRTDAHAQPISFTTVTGTANPAGTLGGYAGLNKLGQPIRILGAGGLEHHVQDTYKLKASLDLTAQVKAVYVLGVWTDDTTGGVQSYLTDATGAVTYKTAASGATTGFNAAVYTRDALHISQALSLQGTSSRVDWQIIGTVYDYSHDWQNNPSPDATSATTASTGFISVRNDLPGAFTGGVGTIQKQDGTGWATLDGKAAIRLGSTGLGEQVVSLGAHLDKETLNAATYALPNWLDSHAVPGQLRSASHGETRTDALWVQDVITLNPSVSVTLGGRYEWWRATGGANTTRSTTVNATLAQPQREFDGFSPKAALNWTLGDGMTARIMVGQAYRTPTVGELYQTTTIGTQLTNPNPGLKPEQASSIELALERRGIAGGVRVSLFGELIKDALISQLNAATNATYVQNVDRTRARGVEVAADRQNILPGVDATASVTWVDAGTTRDTIFPAAVGKLLPGVPHWKGSAVVTWHATPRLTLSAAARFASRNYANLANDDVVGNTYQGFYKYFVMDTRAVFKITENLDVAIGIDNLNNQKYFLYHPFPQRSVTAQINWKQ